MAAKADDTTAESMVADFDGLRQLAAAKALLLTKRLH